MLGTMWCDVVLTGASIWCKVVRMSTRMSITIEDGLYRELESCALENERSISQEITYRLRKFNAASGVTQPVTNSFSEAIKDSPINMVISEQEQRVIDELEKIYGDGYQPDSEELSRLNKMIDSAGCEYWDAKKVLFRITPEGKKVIKKF